MSKVDAIKVLLRAAPEFLDEVLADARGGGRGGFVEAAPISCEYGVGLRELCSGDEFLQAVRELVRERDENTGGAK